MAYTSVDNPELYFQTQLYTGNGGTQSITLDGSENMQPDWVWIKNRSGTDIHALYDSVRGVNKNLRSDANSAEGSQSTGLTSFDSDGFGVGDTGSVNTNSNNFVSWNWKMGTSFSNDASATSVGTIDSTGSINTAAGQSIISYSGTGSAGTIAHGLNAIPKMIMIKETSGNASGGNQSWSVYHQDLGNTHFIPLNSTEAKIDDVDFNDTTPTSSVFSVGVQNRTNSSNGNGVYIAYVFAEKKGYSKFGSFTGNASVDGPFLYTGFKPAYFLIKNASDGSANWQVWDNKRAYAFNEVQAHLYPNTNGAEVSSTGYNNCDFVSNGIKVREDNGDFNGSGNTVIWMAFAESPFVNSSGVPNNAR